MEKFWQDNDLIWFTFWQDFSALCEPQNVGGVKGGCGEMRQEPPVVAQLGDDDGLGCSAIIKMASLGIYFQGEANRVCL